MGPEAKIEKGICDYAKGLGCLCYKFSSPNHRGVPDRIIVSPSGSVLFLELKAVGKIPTKLQLREIQKLRSNGAHATWTDSIEEGKALLDQICQG